MRAEVGSGRAPGVRAFGGVILDFGNRLEKAEGVGKCSGKSRIAMRDGLALKLVCREKTRRGLPAHDGGKLPTEVDGILYRGVVAETARRREQMCRVAGNEHTGDLKTLRHQRV